MINKTYHVYLEDRCLFKNLNQQEFQIIWEKLYKDYIDGLTFEELEDKDNTENYIEHSY